MAEQEWEVKIRNLAADEDIVVAKLGPRQVAKLGLPLDLISEFGSVYQVTATISQVVDDTGVEERAKERRALDDLANAAGRKIRKMLKEQGHAP